MHSIFELKCGDCLELMKQIPDGSVDMILCDLPYGKTECKWDAIIPFDQMWNEYKRIIKGNGCIALFGSEPFASRLRLSSQSFYRYDWVWKKNKATQYLNANRVPLLDYEVVCIFYKKLPTYNPQMSEGKSYSNRHKPGDSGEVYGKVAFSERNNITTRYPRRIVDFNVETKPVHPTQKPVALLEYLVKTSTNEGETVLDNCMGSGSTGVACMNTGRRFIGIELDKQYFDIAQKRIEEAKNRVLQL